MRHTVSNSYLRKGFGVLQIGSEQAKASNPSCYVSIHRNRSEAEAEADRLNGDTRFADSRRVEDERRSDRKARREAEGPRSRDRNIYAAICCKCGRDVAPGEGYIYRHSGANARGMKKQRESYSQFVIRIRCADCGEGTR